MFILASASPRRQELLRQIVDDFKVIPADINEDVQVKNIRDLPSTLSMLKADKICQSYPSAIILAADTIVIFNNHILGKPHSKEQAIQMLTELSGNTHLVITGYTLIKNSIRTTRSVETFVEFNKLSPETIEAYIATNSPFDKAGGYGIQDKEFNLVKAITGSYSNVMGLPLEDIIKYL